VPVRVRLSMVAAVLAVSVFSACDGGRSDEAAGAGSEPSAGNEVVVSPRESVPAPGQPCSDATATTAAVADDATVTLGPINGVEATTADGVPLVVLGTVYAQDCEPLAGARLTMWQTDGAGDYGPGHGTDDMRCCYLGGDVQTDAAGRFQLITVRPGHYRGEPNPPPAHIHLEVRHSDVPRLDTEIVFADDDRLPPNAERLGLVVTHPTRDGDGWHANAEIVMGGSRE
jgi:protocatechuate 3,4-dioxygenase beta subunit